MSAARGRVALAAALVALSAGCSSPLRDDAGAAPTCDALDAVAPVDALFDAPADAPPASVPIAVNARAAPYNAAGDGHTDDTAAIQRALDDAGRSVPGAPPYDAVVYLPAGNYLVRGDLAVPSHVELVGSLRAPPSWSPSLAATSGTVLYAVADAGSRDGTAFVTLAPDATLRGLGVFYPEQTATNPPRAYPWTVRAAGPRVTVRDVMLANAFRGIDLASADATDGHTIVGVYGQALDTGIAIDHCGGGGSLTDVHLFPFWNQDWTTIRGYQSTMATAVTLAGVTGETMQNVFAIGYRTGFFFAQSAAGVASSGTITNLNFDTTGVCLDVYQTAAAGWTIDGLNCVVDTGSYQFPIWSHAGATANLTVSHASFWGGNASATPYTGLQEAVLWAGDGRLTLTDSTMLQWNPSRTAVDVRGGHVELTGNFFGDGVGVAVGVSGSGQCSAVGNQMVGDRTTGSLTARGNAM